MFGGWEVAEILSRWALLWGYIIGQCFRHFGIWIRYTDFFDCDPRVLGQLVPNLLTEFSETPTYVLGDPTFVASDFHLKHALDSSINPKFNLQVVLFHYKPLGNHNLLIFMEILPGFMVGRMPWIDIHEHPVMTQCRRVTEPLECGKRSP